MLSKFGLKGGTLRWLMSYLSCRELQVKIKGVESEPFFANTGVPQGSHLGPILFIIFINDIGDKLKIPKILVFADDIKIFTVII